MAARRRWPLVLLIVACAVIVVLFIAFVGGLASFRSFSIVSGAMENTLQRNDRVFANNLAGTPARGEIVAFAPPASWRSEGNIIQRVIGIGGDRVVCCDAAGKVSVNGYALTESYLYPGSTPSTLRFDVKVPAGRLFVLGDHREISGDSRYHPADNMGTIPVTSVMGPVTAIYWPPSRATKLSVPEVFSHVPSQ
jgi:signal peptidase I